MTKKITGNALKDGALWSIKVAIEEIGYLLDENMFELYELSEEKIYKLYLMCMRFEQLQQKNEQLQNKIATYKADAIEGCAQANIIVKNVIEAKIIQLSKEQESEFKNEVNKKIIQTLNNIHSEISNKYKEEVHVR